ncbi:MAG: quercetin dioxygenase-like cupin family protein [Pirellulaceae bacterium]|jgi:quercetin dioxygenase-like cupin family protein
MSKYIVKPADASFHNIFPGVDIRTVAGDKMMLSLVEMEPHAVVEKHSHPHEQMGLLLEGECEFIIGDDRQIVKAGEMWRIPGGVEHKVINGDKPGKALDVFHPIRQDYL